MKAAPSISVVLPAYNAEASLPRAVESILTQEERDFELILLDDGSSDGTLACARAFQKTDPRVRVGEGPHEGVVATLNRGMDMSRGRYIARMDADDVSYPQRLRAQRESLDAQPEVGLVACRVDYGGDPAARRGYARYVEWTNELLSSDEIALNRFVESSLAHPSVMFRRALVEASDGYRDGPFPEDYDLWLRWLEKGVVMRKLPERLLRWNDPPDRLSRSDPRCSPEAFYRCKTRYLARWLAKENSAHPEVIVWGAGRTTRKRAALLEDHGVTIRAYVDIDPAKVGQTIEGRPVIAPDELSGPGEAFILPYVGSWDARSKITAWLDRHGYRRGRDYICAA